MNRRYKKSLLTIILVLVLLRLCLPAVALAVLNNVLDKNLGTYRGHVEDLDLSLYRGAYQLQGLEIKKIADKGPPLVFIKEIDLSLAWRALLKNEINADVTVEAAQINLADSQDKSKKQIGIEDGVQESKENWRALFKSIIPISIESLEIHNSAVSFVNRDLKVPYAVELKKIELHALNLRTHSVDQFSPFGMSAQLQKHADLKVDGQLNILSEKPEFDMNLKIENFHVNTVNEILRHYIPLDITKGDLSLYSEAVAAGGRAHGYVKVFLSDGDIIAPKQNYLGVKHFFIEIISAFGNWLLKNNKTHKVAFKLPFTYENKKIDINGSDAFWSAVENSGDALKTGFDNSVNLPKKNLSK
jgi:hypothetical protein